MKLSRLTTLGLAGILLAAGAAARAETDSDTIKRLQDQLQALSDAQQRLQQQEAANEKELADLREKLRLATQRPPAPPPTPGAPAPPERVRISGDVTNRIDSTSVNNRQTGIIPEGTQGIFRQRVRLNFDTPISHRSNVGLQVTTGENNTPTVPFIAMGDAFRGKGFLLGRAYLTYHFGDAADPNELVLHLGKMPNPFWRAEAGGYLAYASEIVWDNDVSPEGIAIRAPLTHRGAKVGLTNTLGVYLINWVPLQRFVGLTTQTWQLENQLKLDAGSFKGAIGYLFFNHLNSGLHVPIFIPGFGVDPTTATSAFLLRPPLQATNEHYGYAPNAFGFGNDQFHIINVTTQYLHGGGKGPGLHPFAVGEYLHNFSVPIAQSGWGVSAGVTRGGNAPGAWTTWLTYRDVSADATVATFADSDLGAGTDYRGFQFGAVYRLKENLLGRISVNEFKGYPRKDNSVGRVFVDVTRPF